MVNKTDITPLCRCLAGGKAVGIGKRDGHGPFHNGSLTMLGARDGQLCLQSQKRLPAHRRNSLCRQIRIDRLYCPRSLSHP
jgi:hypothetical protein